MKNLPPLGADPLNKFLARVRLEQAQAKLLSDIAREEGWDLKEKAEERHRFRSKLPGDPLSLRGLPAIGRSVAGAIRGTQPEREVLRRCA